MQPAREAATRRAEVLQRVATFESARLADLIPQDIGQSLKDSILEALEEAPLP